MAFTSCRRFAGKFYLRPSGIEVAARYRRARRSLPANPGSSRSSSSPPELAATRCSASLAGHLNRNHPPLAFSAPPPGWCSWYCFGPEGHAPAGARQSRRHRQEHPGAQVRADRRRLSAGDGRLARDRRRLRRRRARACCRQIRERGFEPAIWVAPFIAEEGSHLFQQHPDWFVKDDDGTAAAARIA